MSLLALAALLAQVAAPPPDYSVGIRHAAGRPSSGGWQTYLVELDNRAAAEREFRIELHDEYSEARAFRTERLGPKSRKRLHVYLPVRAGTWTSNIRHRVAVDGRQPGPWSEIDSQRWQGNGVPVALLSSDPATPDAFGLPLSGDRPLEVGRFTHESFPDRRLGLTPFQALILHAPDWDQFTVDQGRAIADFVRAGGLLVVSAGPKPGALSHPILKEIADIQSGTLEEVRGDQGLERYGAWRSPDPWRIHRLSNGRPFKSSPVRVYPAGLGEVRVIPFDVRRPPFDAWPGLRSFWLEILFQQRTTAFPPDSVETLPAFDAGPRMAMAAAIADRVSPYPSLVFLTSLVAVFILILGPLNYGLLRRRRAPLLAVVTLPGLSFLLLGLMFVFGTAIKGVSVRSFTVRILSAPEGGAWARETAILSIYSPSARSYDVPASGGFAFTPIGRQAWERGLPFAAETGAGIVTRDIPIGQWQTAHLEADGIRPFGKGLRFSAEGASVAVENGTPLDLLSCAVLAPDARRWIRVGPVAAGATARVRAEGSENAIRALDLEPDSLAGAALRPYSRRHLRQDSRRVLLAVVRESGPAASIDGVSRAEAVTLVAVPEGAR